MYVHEVHVGTITSLKLLLTTPLYTAESAVDPVPQDMSDAIFPAEFVSDFTLLALYTL